MKGVLKTLCVSLWLAAAPAFATGLQGADPESAFADCAGRFMAELEYSWLRGGEDAEAEALHATFNELLDTFPAPAAGDTRLARRSASRIHQRKLLSQATFASDPKIRRIAATTAQNARRACTALVVF